MKNAAFYVLKTFSKDELRKFKVFLNSPFFNTSNKVIKLFDEVLKYHPSYDSPKLNMQNLHKKITPNLKYNPITIRRLIFDLEKQSLLFLEYIGLEKNGIQRNEFLRKELSYRGVSKVFYKNVKHIESHIYSNCYLDEEYFFRKLILENDKFNFSSINKKVSNKQVVDSESLNLILSSKYLLMYFIMNMVRHYISIYTLDSTFKGIESKNYFATLLDNFFSNIDFNYLREFLEDQHSNFYFLIEIYFNLFKSVLEFKDDSYYFKLKELVLSNLNFLSNSEKRFLFVRLINCCILKKLKGVNIEVFNKELLLLYEIVLSKKYYLSLEQPYLPDTLYTNILKFGLELKKFKWIEQFIEQYSNKLHPSLRINMKNYSFAIYYFKKKDFINALNYINKVDYDIYRLKFEIRSLSLMTHYELENYEVVSSIVLSYKAFIKNSPLITKENRIRYMNFLMYIDKFIKFINNRNKTYIDFMRDKLIATKDIIHKDWLLEKINELMPPTYKTNVA